MCARPDPVQHVQVNAILSSICAEDSTLWLVRVTGTRVALIRRIDGGSPQVDMCAACSAALHCISRFEAQYTPAVGAHHWCAARTYVAILVCCACAHADPPSAVCEFQRSNDMP